MENKILCVTDFYLPTSYANGICLNSIVNELEKRGNEVHVLCINNSTSDNNNKNNKVHYVDKSLFLKLLEYGEKNINTSKGKLIYRLSFVIHRIGKIFFLPFFPMSSFINILVYYKKIKKLHSDYNYTTIISTYCPFEAVISGLLMKKKYKRKIKFGVYILDSLSNSKKSNDIYSKWVNKMGMKRESEIFPNTDFILYMKSYHDHHLNKFYDKYRYKMIEVDIPLFKKYYLGESINVINTNLTWVYAGALSRTLRNPDYACEIFKLLNEKNKELYCKLDFYSRGDCENLIEDYSKITNGAITRNGYVERTVVINSIKNAGVLVSIGNNNSSMVPSKIFEYMSTGKVIIHFFYNTDDSSLFYLKKYPNALLINRNDGITENLKLINNFLENKREIVEFDEIKKKYLENTPEYTVDMIEKFI